MDVFQELYTAAAEGKCKSLDYLLCLCSEKTRRYYTEETFTTSDGCIISLLGIACFNGQSEVVNLLVKKYHCDIELECRLKMPKNIYQTGTPLWFAAFHGQTEICTVLLQNGARIDRMLPLSDTETNAKRVIDFGLEYPTALHAAIFAESLSVVQLLIAHGCNVNIARNMSCLMQAVRYDCILITIALLDANADMGYALPDSGWTALHLACIAGSINTVDILMSHGAPIMTDHSNLNPLSVAGDEFESATVTLLINKYSNRFTTAQIKECFELQAVNYCYFEICSRLRTAFDFLLKAVILKSETSENDSITIGNVTYRECLTIAELKAIQLNQFAIRMQCLLITKRIFGAESGKFLDHVFKFSRQIIKTENYSMSLNLMLYMLENTQNKHELIFYCLNEVFDNIQSGGGIVPFDILCRILTILTEELEKNKIALRDTPSESSHQDIHFNMQNAVKLIVVTTKYMEECTDKTQCNQLRKLVYKINEISPHDGNKTSLFHFILDSYHVPDEQMLLKVAELMISTNAKLGADILGKNPLHIFVERRDKISDSVIKSIILLLISAGIHLHNCTKNGSTARDIAYGDTAREILKIQEAKEINLYCKAAISIRKFRLEYKKVLPHTMVQFVNLHGSQEQLKNDE